MTAMYTDVITKSELHLSDIADELDEDWVRLAAQLGFKNQDISRITNQNDSTAQQV